MQTARRRLLDLAAAQEGVVTRDETRAAGIPDGVIDRCLGSGLLAKVAPGVFRARGAPQTERMAIRAAVCGAHGLACGGSAVRILRLGAPIAVSPIHVLVDGVRRRPRIERVEVEAAGHAFFRVAVHRTLHFHGPRLTVDGIPTVDPARALIDAAPALVDEELEAAFERARVLGLVSTEALARRFAELGGRGRPGTPKIRRLLEHAAPKPLESRLESKAWRMLRRSTLEMPIPQLKVRLASGHRHRIDFAWPELQLGFETEGFEWHGSRARWKQDKVRTARLERAGWRLVVATWDDVVRTPADTLDRLALALAERRALRHAS